MNGFVVILRPNIEKKSGLNLLNNLCSYNVNKFCWLNILCIVVNLRICRLVRNITLLLHCYCCILWWYVYMLL